MADLAQCSRGTIQYWMTKHGISRRARIEACQSERCRNIKSKQGKARWADKEYRERQIKIYKARWQDEEYRCHMIEILYERWQDKDYQQLQSDRMIALWASGRYDCIFQDEEYRAQMSETQKQLAAENPESEETRYKKSQSGKRAWREGKFGTEEHRRRISEGQIKNWQDENYKQQFRNEMQRRWREGVYGNEAWQEKHSQAMKAAWARGCFDNAFQGPTSIELQVAAALDVLGLEHKSQYRPDGYSRVFDEFVLPNILIEAQGDYWHTRDGQPERDAEKAAWAKEHGYDLIIIWESEINEFGAWSLVAQRVLPLTKGA